MSTHEDTFAAQRAAWEDAVGQSRNGDSADDPEPGSSFVPVESVPAAGGGRRVVLLAEFVAVEEATTAPLLGSDDKRLIAAGSSLVLYGEGGSGKTTLAIDLACHLAAGVEWLGFPIAEPVTVMLLENEGPRAEYRLKLRRKIAAWDGPDFVGRIVVHDEPWGSVDFRRDVDIEGVAAAIREHEVDVLIAGPIRRLGLEGGGTPAETVAFMQLLDRLRDRAGRAVANLLVHHENKGGDISGAFEAEFDTVVHVKADGRDRTQLFFRKSRWSSKIHRSRATLAWIPDTEGFTVVETDIDGPRGLAARDAERSTADTEALVWLVDNVTTRYAETGEGVPRGKLETAYQEAHPERGSRARARRVIDEQIVLAVALAASPSTGSERRALPTLAVANGERAGGKYVYPTNHAPSPLAEVPNGEHGEQTEHPLSEPSLAVRRSVVEERRTASTRRRGSEIDDLQGEVERLAAKHEDLA